MEMDLDYEKIKANVCGPSVIVQAPFEEETYELDIDALKENIQFIIDGGIKKGAGHIICPCGTGEYVTLSHEEHLRMVEAALDVTGDKLPVVVGIASCNYKEVIELAENAVDAGAECAMIPPPFYYTLGQDDIYRWYKIIAEGTDIALMAYNQFWRGGIGSFLSVPLIGRLTEIESMVSMKYGGEVMKDYVTALGLHSERFTFIDNSIAYTAAIGHMHGGRGFITGPGNFMPEFEAKYWNLLEQHKYVEAEKWHARLGPLWEFIRGIPGTSQPTGLFDTCSMKAAMDYVGLHGGPVRPPFEAFDEERRKEFYSVLEAMEVKRKQ